jgi:hypothetical protein
MLQSEASFGNVRDAAYVEWSMSGDMYPMDGSSLMLDVSSLRLPATSGVFSGLYSEAYLGIGSANYTIGRVGQMENLDAGVKSLIIGQAKFLRGLFYYRLVNYFGGVPLILEELNASSNLNIPRASSEEIWSQIEQDFNEAISILPIEWGSKDVGRITKGAALGYLIKAYLWQGKWNDALQASEEIINSGIYALLPDFRDVFLETNKNNKEILFSTQYRAGTEGEGNSLPIRTAPRGAPSEFTGAGAWSNFVPQKHWVNAAEKDTNGKIKDLRYWRTIIGPGEANQDMPKFIMPINVPAGMSISGYIVTKYWQKPTIGQSGVNAPILRYAEVLLNYAEALNELNRSEDAIQQVNLIRSRAGLESKPLNLTKDEVLDAIYYERRMEFIWEPSGGFSDLNRRGRFMDFIKNNRPDFTSLQIDAKPWIQTIPIRIAIPKTAWDRNKALIQNPGYPPF